MLFRVTNWPATFLHDREEDLAHDEQEVSGDEALRVQARVTAAV